MYDDPDSHDSRTGINWLGHDPDGGYFARCPACQNDCTHIKEVRTALGNDPSEGGTAYPGTVAKGVVNNRRNALILEFECESGHRFEVVIQQQMGVNSISAKVKN